MLTKPKSKPPKSKPQGSQTAKAKSCFLWQTIFSKAALCAAEVEVECCGIIGMSDTVHECVVPFLAHERHLSLRKASSHGEPGLYEPNVGLKVQCEAPVHNSGLGSVRRTETWDQFCPPRHCNERLCLVEGHVVLHYRKGGCFLPLGPIRNAQNFILALIQGMTTAFARPPVDHGVG